MSIKVGDTVSERCPCCGKQLYKHILVSANPDVWSRSADSPRIKQDAKGDFMDCRHCKRRIAFERAMGPEGWILRPSEKQDCG